MNTSLGYSKRTLDNTKVLLSGGGDKLLSDFIGSISWDAQTRKIKYTPVGGTATDLVTFGSNAFTNDSNTYIRELDYYKYDSAENKAYRNYSGTDTVDYLKNLSMFAYDKARDEVIGGRAYPNGLGIYLMRTYPDAGSTAGVPKYSGGLYLASSGNTAILFGYSNNNWFCNTIYHSGNLPAYPTKASWNYDDMYVKSVSISENSLRVNKNGTNEDLTIPFATSATTATKIKINTSNPTSGTAYYLPFTSAVSGNRSIGANDGIIYYTLEGTTEAEGKSYLFIGNDVASGTAGNKKGLIRIYASTAYYGQFKVANITENKTYTFNSGGTILTSGNYNSYALPLSGGTLTGNTDIDTGSTADARFGVTNTNASGTSIYLLAATNRGVYHSTAGWLITTNGTNSWLNIGNVGIGTDSPTYKLHVNGTANATTIYENGKSLASKYLALAGGTMNDKAVISRSCTSANISWYQGRLYPIIKTTSYTGYNSILSMKTTNGSWDLGVYSSDTAYLTYIKDSDYNAGNNTSTYQLTFPKKTGTLAITDDIAWSNVSDKPSTFAPSSDSSYYLTRDSWWANTETHDANDLTSGIVFAYDASYHSNTATTGTLVTFSCQSNGNYALQLQGQYSGENLYFRNRNGDNGTWKTWRHVIHSGNISSQSVNYATSAGNVTGTVAIANGGTGSTTAAGARANLGTWALISDSYDTLIKADGSTNGWIKIGTSNSSYGLLPSASGGAGSGHNYLGTSSWYWKYAYIDQIYGYLYGTGATMTGSITPNTDNAIDLGSSTKRWRYIYSCGMWGISGTALRLGGNDATLMYLTSDAKCGIGTDSPSYKLHVSGTAYAENGYFYTSTGAAVKVGKNTTDCFSVMWGGDNTHGIYNNTSGYWLISTNASGDTWLNCGTTNVKGLISSGNITISHAASATMTADSTNPKITFAESGSLPVHLTYSDWDNYRAPAGLKVVGGANATPAWFEVEGNTYSANFYTTSDRSKKQNISSFSEHIRKFQLKDTEKWHYGVIALEVPEMFRDGKEGNMTVNYTSILSYYVGLLENKVASLEKELSILKQKLK